MRTETYLIKPHEFRHPIKIYKQVEGISEEGLPLVGEEGLEEVLSCRAKIVHISGKDVQLAEGISNIKSTRFIIRYPLQLNEEINETYKLKYKDSLYNITYAKNIEERNIYLDLLAEKVS